jgi:DNA repair protein RadC
MKPGRTLLDLGAERCSDTELLAILLGSGGRGYSALDSANALLDKYGTLAGLMDRPLDEIADDNAGVFDSRKPDWYRRLTRCARGTSSI